MSVKNLRNTSLRIGIIGAGPAGALAAYLLAQKGHRVQVMERRKDSPRKVCGEYLCPKGVELLDTLGLRSRLASDFLPLHGMVLVSPENDVITSYFPQSEKKEEGLSLNRELFDNRLVNLAVEAGAEILFGKTVINTSFLPDEEKWLVSTEGEDFKYDLLIAADGRQSKVAHILGHQNKINTDRMAFHCYLPRKTNLGLRLGEMHILNDGSYCGLDPIHDERVNFSIVCKSDVLKTKKTHDVINQTIASSKRLSAMFDSITNDEEVRIVTTLKNSNSFVAGNRLAYLGDAAGFIDPLTGEGIYNALLSAHILCESIESHEDLQDALMFYKKKKKHLAFQKNMINHFFQFLIRKPFLIRLTVKFLKKSPVRANHFIGIVGNINTPLVGAWKMIKS